MVIYRMGTKALCVCILGVLVSLHCCAAQVVNWSVYTHNVEHQAEPVDGSLVGIAHAGKRAYFIEVAHALLDELGIAANITEVPFALGMLYVSSREGVVFFNVSRIPERENQVVWIGPVLTETSYLYQLKGNPDRLQSLEDAKHKAVCVLNKNVHDLHLTALGFTNLRRAYTYSDCFRLLVSKQVELVASASIGIQQKLSAAKIASGVVQRTSISIGAEDSYIVLSRHTPEEELGRWDAALKRLRERGKIAALYKQFIPSDQ